jgi:hypothetical protein
MGGATPIEALEPTALVALKEPKWRRFTGRRLTRFLSERPGTALEDAAIVVACLGALGGARHAQALA